MALAASVSGRGNEEGSASVEPSSSLEPWFINDETDEEWDTKPGVIRLGMEMEGEAWHLESVDLPMFEKLESTFNPSFKDFLKKYGYG
jgi:hypothetical protein